ncbi:MAG: hypothetical protein ACJAW1_002463 [Glaciecola sp.]|jgi:hypothetical protein
MFRKRTYIEIAVVNTEKHNLAPPPVKARYIPQTAEVKPHF